MKVLQTILLFVLISIPMVKAEPPIPKIRPLPVVCLDYDIIVKGQQKFNESMRFLGVAGEKGEGLIEFWWSNNYRHWSVVLRDKTGIACVIASGNQGIFPIDTFVERDLITQ